MEKEVAVCRGCKRILKGEPYYTGKPAYHPDTNERCKVNYYGGYVCSEECDYRASKELEDSMPGGKGVFLSSQANRHIRNNWQSNN